jgi:peptidoglycan hydrolase-like protein with peptidoglycan-binding domain
MRCARLGLALALVGATVVVLPAESAYAGSADVAALQVAMRTLGLYPHPVDGITGPWTRSAVRHFQSRNGLSADGIAGPKTRRTLGRRGRPPLGSRLMRKEDRGWDVAALQFLLKSRGYGEGGLDGDFGPNTDRAVRRFQRAAGLAVDGVAGPATLHALKRRQLSAPAPTGPVSFLRPVSGPIADGFGWVGGRRHTGVDFPQPMGAPVGAAGVGVVGFAGWNSGGYGNLVVVKHRLGYETWYAHLSQIAVGVGQAVAGGSRIGYIGSTGYSTGPHLHFEVRHFGTPIDPVPLLLPTTAARAGRGTSGRIVCRPNPDARSTKDTDPPFARIGRCP